MEKPRSSADSVGSPDSVDFSSTTDRDSVESRDEVKEILKYSRKETKRVQTWRLLVTLALVATGVIVTVMTYRSLVDQEEQNFEDAYGQFSRTVRASALQQQTRIQQALKGIAESITVASLSTNATWPMFRMPYAENFMMKALEAGGMEVMTLGNFVKLAERAKYIEFVNENHEAWLEESHMIRYGNLDKFSAEKYNPFIKKKGPTGHEPDDSQEDIYVLNSYSPPPFNFDVLNGNYFAIPFYNGAIRAAEALRNESTYTYAEPGLPGSGIAMTTDDHSSLHSSIKGSDVGFPHTFVIHPVHEQVTDPESPILGIIQGAFAWDFALRNLLPDGVSGMTVVLKNNCNQTYTYTIDGKDAYYVGEPGDFHDRDFNHYQHHFLLTVNENTHPNFTTTPGHCYYEMDVYPSQTFKDQYTSDTPMITCIVIAITFFIVVVTFFVYDIMVQRRNMKLVQNAAKSNAVVTSLFPGAMRDRVLEQGALTNPFGQTKSKMKNFLTGAGDGTAFDSKPLAELFLETTVMFADIAGFTAWSSSREPSQVFTLLEVIYNSFDQIAKKHGIYKVETVGDCYVAVAGLPDVRHDHALAVASFSRECLAKFLGLTKQLEVRLGPDTSDLGLRIGIHSGPVTAGVLRGERARFQLFGDTMNVTARIECTGRSNCIQVSKETAELLQKSGHGDMLTIREDPVEAKGKGFLETYWLSTLSTAHHWASSVDKKRVDRLVAWNVEILHRLLKQVVARRNALGKKGIAPVSKVKETENSIKQGKQFVEEIIEIIELPEFDTKDGVEEDPAAVVLNPEAVLQLEEYVTCISRMYRNNPFHNFEHASHVCMSVEKLLARIVAPSDLVVDGKDDKADHQKKLAMKLHDHTYGITSDPLTQFACTFSALIHDVDHTGVPNTQLIEEQPQLGASFNNRSVAEQNSLALAWDLLMEPRFEDLREVIYATPEELRRFRELVVNGVMATDIADKGLKTLRNSRWARAFDKESEFKEDARASVNRKATIVIEHLIQASDVAHTMQHWHVYRKWNERLFREMYVAYKTGRAEKNPAEFWAKGEIGFFDFYIIPLAKKLKDCGVFGVSSGEYLNYAMCNRTEWELRGEEIVAEMLQKFASEDDFDEECSIKESLNRRFQPGSHPSSA